MARRGEIIKDILSWLLIGGMVAIAATSPYFLYNILRSLDKRKQYNKQSVANTFYRLRKEGLIVFQKHNNQLYISLSEEGKTKAGKFQINSLNIQRPKKWDGKWRIIIFDISDLHRIKREALRGLLKRLQFYKLQESVWIHPFDCKREIELLKDFFGFTSKEIQLIIAEQVENPDFLRTKFKI
jgi:DNA-binding transcriptional regulator PaaX